MASQQKPARSPEMIRDQLQAKLHGLVEASVSELHEIAVGERVEARVPAETARANVYSSEPQLRLEPHDGEEEDGALSQYASVEDPPADSGDEPDDETFEGLKTAIERSSQQSSPVSPEYSGDEPRAPAAQPYQAPPYTDTSGEAAFLAAKAKGEAEAKQKTQLRRQRAAARKSWDHSPKAASPSGGGGPASAGRSTRGARGSDLPRHKSAWEERGPTPGERICVIDRESPHVHKFGQIVEHRTRLVRPDTTRGQEDSPALRVGTVSIRLEDRAGHILQSDPPFVVQLSAIVPAEAADIKDSFHRPRTGKKSGSAGQPTSRVGLPSTVAAEERYELAQLNRVIKALRKKTGASNLPPMTEQDFSELQQRDSSARGLLFCDFAEWYVDKLKTIQEEDKKKKTAESFNLAQDISSSTIAEALRAVKRADRERKEQERNKTRAAERERKDREAQERRNREQGLAKLEEETKRLRKELASKTSREELSKKYRYRDAEARRELHRREREEAMSPGKSPEMRGVRHSMKMGAMQASAVQSWAGMVRRPESELAGTGAGPAGQGSSSPSARSPSAFAAKNGVSISFEYDEKHIAAHEKERSTLVARQETGRLYELAELNRVIKALRKKTGASKLPLMTEQEFSELLQPDSSARGLLFRDFTEWYVRELKNTGESYNLAHDISTSMLVEALRTVKLANPDFGDGSSSSKGREGTQLGRKQRVRPQDPNSSPGLTEPEPEPEPEPVRGRAAQWTVEDVVAWLTDIGLGEYGSQFRQQQMEGTALQRLCVLLNQDGGVSGNAKTQAVWRRQVEDACGLKKLGHFLVFWSELSKLDF